VLAKNKTDTDTQFIDATSEEFFNKATNTNIMDDGHIKTIMDMFDSKADVTHVAATVPYETVVEKDYNLSVTTYVMPKDTREVVDIDDLNAEIKSTVSKIDRLRIDIDAIVKEIEA
jgi:type I restriction enzyme M protein